VPHGSTAAEQPRRILHLIPRLADGETHSLAEDRSLTLDHPPADLDWAVRHALQYGSEVTVLEPDEVRQAVCAWARAAERVVTDRHRDQLLGIGCYGELVRLAGVRPK
jgi:hypothetical protein